MVDATATGDGARRPRRAAVLPGYLMLAPALGVLTALLVLPVAILGAYSFYRYVDVGVEAPAFDTRNWVSLFTDPFYHHALLTTGRIALIVTALCVVGGYIPAYVVARTRYRRRWLLMLLMLLPFWISFVIRTMSWIHVLGAHGLVNATLLGLGLIERPLELLYGEGAVIMGLTHVMLPFVIINIYVALESIDRNLVPVALTLGASPVGAFLAVTLPLSLPGVASGALLAFVLAAGSYITPMVLGGPDDFLFGNLIYNAAMTELNWPLGATLAIALAALLGMIVVVYNHFLGLDRLARGLS